MGKVNGREGRQVEDTSRRRRKPLLVIMEGDFPDDLAPGESDLLTPFRDRLLEGIGTRVEKRDEGSGKVRG